MGRHSSRVGQRPSQQHLYLGVDAAELVVGPTDERVVDGRIKAKQDLRQELGTSNTLLITYNVNSFDTADVYRHADHCRPRYIDVTFRPSH